MLIILAVALIGSFCTNLFLMHRKKNMELAKFRAEIKLEEALRNFENQKELLEKAKQEFALTFQTISGASLKNNNEAFLQLAQERLNSLLKEAKGDMANKEDSIKSIVKPLEESLRKYEEHIRELEKNQVTSQSNLENYMKNLMFSTQQLQKETGNLVTALRRPEVRGRWGEITLRRVVELAGMVEFCDYEEQKTVQTEGGRLRPDLVISLPGGRKVIVDSKVPLDAYLSAIASEKEEDKKMFFQKHAQQLKTHMKMLSGKDYAGQFADSLEFVVMFIPGDVFFNAAVEVDRDIVEEGMKIGVIIATPTTLIGLLRTVSYGWKQERIAQHAKKIAEIADELYERMLPFLQHYQDVGKHLKQSVDAFNRAGSSLESRVLVSMRRLKEFGVSFNNKELAEISSVDVSVKSLVESEDSKTELVVS